MINRQIQMVLTRNISNHNSDTKITLSTHKQARKHTLLVLPPIHTHMRVHAYTHTNAHTNDIAQLVDKSKHNFYIKFIDIFIE